MGRRCRQVEFHQRYGHDGSFVGKGMGAKEWGQKPEIGFHSLATIPLPFLTVVVISIRE
jgi:hypothetical protein